MELNEIVNGLHETYNIVDTIDISAWQEEMFSELQKSLKEQVCRLSRDAFVDNERILVIRRTSDLYVGSDGVGLALRSLQVFLNECKINNYFVIIVSDALGFYDELEKLEQISIYSTKPSGIICDGVFVKNKLKVFPLMNNINYSYTSYDPIKIPLDQLTGKHRYLLSQSKTFCMYPWIHMHAWPTGEAFPCCHAESQHRDTHKFLGNTREQPMKEIWNSPNMKELRRDMLANKKNSFCTRCYEQEKSGFFSGRLSANKHHGHHIARIDNTQEDGHLDQFELVYWDLRFSNLCNLKCRSCGHIFSSSWYGDQVAIAGPEWGKQHKPLQIAGRYEGDLFRQLLDHVDHVEQIYFAGGEPLMMDEHYAILDELEKHKMFHVRLIYNTNFTKTKLKDREVFDYWRKFDSVSVGASLDAMGKRAEYIRSGTKWEVIEDNRRRMMEICPNVDFYISSTLSIMNLMHIPDFHRTWVEKGLIRPQDFNINILQDPEFYRIDIAPQSYKKEAQRLYEGHISWLEEVDPLKRATVGFKSAITYMNATDNSHILDKFWQKTLQLDEIRNECIYDFIPELEMLHEATK